MTDLELIAERARNLDAIWNQPHADTAAALARKHAELDLGFRLLREALAAPADTTEDKDA